MCFSKEKYTDLEEVRLYEVFNIRQKSVFYLADSGVHWWFGGTSVMVACKMEKQRNGKARAELFGRRYLPGLTGREKRCRKQEAHVCARV